MKILVLERLTGGGVGSSSTQDLVFAIMSLFSDMEPIELGHYELATDAF